MKNYELRTRRVPNVDFESLKLAIALERERTCPRWGWNHFCKKHNDFVDYELIDICDCISNDEYKITDIIKPLEGLTSVWDLTPSQFKVMM